MYMYCVYTGIISVCVQCSMPKKRLLQLFVVSAVISLSVILFSWLWDTKTGRPLPLERSRTSIVEVENAIFTTKSRPASIELPDLSWTNNSLNINNLMGCGEWITKCTEECANQRRPIPRIVHFIKLESHFTFREWVSVMSARKFLLPEKILVFSAVELEGCWWKRILPYVELHVLPENVWLQCRNDIEISELAHKADFLRTAILYNLGGIYSDTDSIAVKSFDALLSGHQVVLSRVDNGGVGNGLVLARKQSCFMCDFARQGCALYDGGWTTHSVSLLQTMPMNKYPGVSLIEDHMRGFFPFGGCIPECQKPLFEKSMEEINFNLSQVYAVHLFNKLSSENQRLYLHNYTWLTTAHSAVAAAIRLNLPSWFNETHMNETLCIDFPQDNFGGTSTHEVHSPRLVLQGNVSLHSDCYYKLMVALPVSYRYKFVALLIVVFVLVSFVAVVLYLFTSDLDQ